MAHADTLRTPASATSTYWLLSSKSASIPRAWHMSMMVWSRTGFAPRTLRIVHSSYPVMLARGTRLAFFGRLCRGETAGKPDRSLHVVDEVGKPDLHPRSGQTDRAHDQSHRPLLVCEHVLDGGSHLRLGPVRPSRVLGHRLARRLLAVDLRASAVLGQEPLVRT